MTLFRVKYPSGTEFCVRGHALDVLDLSFGSFPAVVTRPEDGACVMLDPRGLVYVGDDLVYNPREHVGRMGEYHAGWMEGNPMWPHPEDLS